MILKSGIKKFRCEIKRRKPGEVQNGFDKISKDRLRKRKSD